MHPEIIQAFVRAYAASLRNQNWPKNPDLHWLEIATGLNDESGLKLEPVEIQEINAALESGLAAAFETADYCPSCLEIVPIRDIVLECCFDCWQKMGTEKQHTMLSIAHASSGVDPDALARLERKLEEPRA